MRVGEVELEVRASLGIAVCPDHGDDSSVLLRHADVAMYAAKAAQLPVQTYSAEIDRSNPRRLALVNELGAAPGVSAIAADTDGIDGVESNAGALMLADTVARASALRLDARRRLDDNDGWGFFSALGDLVVTGPTRTNVNDYRAILVA